MTKDKYEVCVDEFASIPPELLKKIYQVVVEKYIENVPFKYHTNNLSGITTWTTK